MCDMASFFYKPIEGVPVAVAILDGHSGTKEKLKLGDDKGPNCWHEGHYTPDGAIVCRGVAGDDKTFGECVAEIKFRWPTFVAFFNWAVKECGPDCIKTLDLRGLTSAAGLTIPSGVKTLDLRGLTSAAGLTIPKGVEYLYLRGLTSAEKEKLLVSIKEE